VRSVVTATPPAACAEQVWNERQLAQPVDTPAWRVWLYDEPAVVLGCSQRRLMGEARDDIDVRLLLRGSGGGAVLVGPWMISLSVVLPVTHPFASGGLMASYRWLGELLAGLLREQAGLAAVALPPDTVRLAPASPALQWACFGSLSPWEVVVDGRKIAGLAQVRRRHGVLLVAGLLLDRPDWPLLCAALRRSSAEAAALVHRTTSWAEQGGPPISHDALAALLGHRLSRALVPRHHGERAPSHSSVPEPA
jgi:lipoate-protein ligase A